MLESWPCIVKLTVGIVVVVHIVNQLTIFWSLLKENDTNWKENEVFYIKSCLETCKLKVHI